MPHASRRVGSPTLNLYTNHILVGKPTLRELIVCG